ncbi:HISTONE DEACETYLASE 3, histone deacetylase 2C [Hibiscus trionum]|uniref:HISTONE DEACETYLASE 3, histone deacetylase 2C n=1 Tax=Hibiscus trionum TaxID=183268 RepID=A0A9W7HNG2_HIBTR|nr:HISTONE DEACETYLASE 3, histone deacetylase 2C [Hibiscus trionum]
MEFWGAEVKSGQNFKVELKNDGSRILHLSQVALGEVTGDNKKGKGNGLIYIYLKFKNDSFVIGTLSQEKFPQIPLDLVLTDTFELSHSWKNGSIYITGYYVETSEGGDSESEEELPQPTFNLAKPPATASDPTASQQVKIVEPTKDEDSSDDEGEDDTSEDEESSEDQDPAMPVIVEKESNNDTDSDEDDSEEESSDEDQETPEKAGPSKKRSVESARKTPAPEKKAKLVTPQKTDGKKVGGHTATPHPAKQAKKASAAAAQAKQTPKSGGSSFPCKSCGRSFGSENALQSHSKAKHGAAAV